MVPSRMTTYYSRALAERAFYPLSCSEYGKFRRKNKGRPEEIGEASLHCPFSQGTVLMTYFTLYLFAWTWRAQGGSCLSHLGLGEDRKEE